MRVVGREAQGFVDPLFELLRDHVLEPLRLVVHVLHVQAEGFREIQLEQAVMPDDLTPCRLASAVTDTRPPSAPSL